MNTKHTPGPWTVVASTAADIADRNGYWRLKSDPYKPVAAIYWGEYDSTHDPLALTTSDNAPLIVAAPALLAALKWALCHVRFSGGPEGDAETFSANYNAAQSAIAQAKGEK